MSFSEKKPGDRWSPEEIAAMQQTMGRADTNALAQALGHFLIMWTTLEQAIFFALRELAKGDAFEVGATAGQLDGFQRLRALAALAAREPRGRPWLADLRLLQKRLEGPLREKRNRFVHDAWVADAEGISHGVFRPKIGTQNEPPSVGELIPITIEEITEVTAELFVSGLLIVRLTEDLRSSNAEPPPQM